jgi:hypothetical protein
MARWKRRPPSRPRRAMGVRCCAGAEHVRLKSGCQPQSGGEGGRRGAGRRWAGAQRTAPGLHVAARRGARPRAHCAETSYQGGPPRCAARRRRRVLLARAPMSLLWLQDMLPARLGEMGVPGGALAPPLTQLALAATLLAGALLLFLTRWGRAHLGCGRQAAAPARRPRGSPPPPPPAGRRRAAAPRHDLDRIPGPWRRAWPLLGNILEVLSPDFHRTTLQWADQYGGFTRCGAVRGRAAGAWAWAWALAGGAGTAGRPAGAAAQRRPVPPPGPPQDQGAVARRGDGDRPRRRGRHLRARRGLAGQGGADVLPSQPGAAAGGLGLWRRGGAGRRCRLPVPHEAHGPRASNARPRRPLRTRPAPRR